jgi:hypothetical protein
VGGDVKIRAEKHVLAHTGGPFLYLWPEIVEEGVGRPTAKDHDAMDGLTSEEERHGGSRTKGVRADIGSVVPKMFGWE